MAAPAWQAAGIALGGRAAIGRAVVAGAAVLCGLLLLVAAPLVLLAPPSGSGPARAPSGIPARFVPVYRESARVFKLNWLVLASVHEQETGYSTHPTTYLGVNSAGCCAGPFQMNVTNGPPSTWESYRAAFRLGQRPASYPHPQTPHPSVYDDFDAAMAAGLLLRANGADDSLGARTWNAVRAYNGSGPIAVAYADAVMTRARAWAQTEPAADAPARPTSAAMAWPVRGPVTSPYCERRAWEACHPGIDIGVPSGTRILASANGRVSLVQATSTSGGYGNFTCLQHTTALSTCYAHQAHILVRLGQLIARGQPIGISDCTGRCYGAHLHFEVRLGNHPICPARYLGASAGALCAPGSPGS